MPSRKEIKHNEQVRRSHQKFKDKQIDWINRCEVMHNYKYDYSKVVYTNIFDKVTITCPIHGEFYQEARGHRRGNGCKKCADFAKNGTNNWRKWKKQAESSDKFDSFKVYIIEVITGDIKFYKIGRTYLTVKERLREISKLYNGYALIKTIYPPEYVEAAEFIMKTEAELHKALTVFKYIPVEKFSGYSECFSQIDLNAIEEIETKLNNFNT